MQVHQFHFLSAHRPVPHAPHLSGARKTNLDDIKTMQTESKKHSHSPTIKMYKHFPIEKLLKLSHKIIS